MNVAENNAQIIQTIVYVPPVLMEGFFLDIRKGIL